MFRTRSAIPGIAWPAIPNPGGAAILAALFQLERSQWWTPDQHWERQREQLGLLLRHAAATCPYYARSFGNRIGGFGPDFTMEAFRQLPILRRADLQSHFSDITSRDVPREHGPTATAVTSGSTGEPVRFASTQLSAFFWQAFNLRDHLWHRREFSRKMVVLRVAAEIEILSNWFGSVGDMTLETGPCVLVPMNLPVEELAQRIVDEAPAYLTGYPNNLAAVLKRIETSGASLPGLEQVRAFGEPVTEEIRAYLSERWRVPLIDLYSTRETGYLALQCPDAEGYHVQSESVYLEVLDNNGEPCEPGESGRVIVTPLHNFAGPLIRYELGDYAEVGPACACGRGLPVIRRILGRSRNLMRLRDGRAFWPLFGTTEFPDLAPVRQFQLVQQSYDELEVRLAVSRPPTDDELRRLGEHIVGNVGYPFRIRWTLLPEIPYNNGGKFEEFICMVRE